MPAYGTSCGSLTLEVANKAKAEILKAGTILTYCEDCRISFTEREAVQSVEVVIAPKESLSECNDGLDNDQEGSTVPPRILGRRHDTHWSCQPLGGRSHRMRTVNSVQSQRER